MSRLRVLVLDEALPAPPDTGKRIRTAALLARLAPAHDITLAFHAEGPVDGAAAAGLEAAGLRLVPVPRRPLAKRGPRFAWDLARNLLLPTPYMAMAHRTRALRAAVGRLVAEAEAAGRPFHLLHAEWLPYAENVPASVRLPRVVSAHNVEATIWARYRAAERSPLRRAYIALQQAKVARFERRVLAAADAVTAVSEGDAEAIRRASGQSDVSVVENGVDGAHFAPLPGVAPEPAHAVFTGSLDWRPNQDGVLWFLEEVWPRVRAAVPAARLSVVGRQPPAPLVARVRAAPGAELHASVPDVRPYLARAAVSVVPLRVGGGSRLKIPEALASGRPVLSTTVGAEGLHLPGGITVADGAEAFAAALVALFAEPARALEQARRGREQVLARYEWGAIAPKQDAVWRRAAARGRRSA